MVGLIVIFDRRFRWAGESNLEYDSKLVSPGLQSDTEDQGLACL
jgi:hypothetical protein